MRFSLFDRRALLALFTILVTGAIAAAGPSHARKAAHDTTVVEINVPDVPPVPDVPDVPPPPRKKIVIGGSGVRIHEEGVDADSGSIHYKFTIDDDMVNEGDAIVKVAESVFIPADETVAGDIVVFGGNAIIEGKVAGSVVVMGGEIRARHGAEIKGDVVAIGGTIEEDEDVIIRGERILVGGVASQIGDRLHIGTRTIRAIISLALLFIGFVLFFITMLFLRTKLEHVSSHISASLLKCFGAGVLTSAVGVFALLIVMIPLIITIVGIPLAVLLAVSCIGVYVIACAAFVLNVGRWIAGRAGIEGGAFVHLFLGVLLVSVPEIIAFVIDVLGHAPMGLYVFFKILSGFLWLCAYVVGLGAIVVSRFGSRPVEPAPPSERMMGEAAAVSS